MPGNFEQCGSCGKDFKQIWTSDPRKGYDVLNEGPKGWRIKCKGCGVKITVPKGEAAPADD